MTRVCWLLCTCWLTVHAALTPPIQVLAARQHATSLLTQNWQTVAERLGGVWSGEAVKAGPSEIHGIGVFAHRDLEPGELVALHPVDEVLQTLADGQIAGALMDEDDSAYFRPSADEELPAEVISYRRLAYRQVYRHVDPSRPETFTVNANPTKDDVQGVCTQ